MKVELDGGEEGSGPAEPVGGTCRVVTLGRGFQAGEQGLQVCVQYRL